MRDVFIRTGAGQLGDFAGGFSGLISRKRRREECRAEGILARRLPGQDDAPLWCVNVRREQRGEHLRKYATFSQIFAGNSCVWRFGQAARVSRYS